MTVPPARRVETLVVGGGAMGSAAAWQLARRGREVALLERFPAGHARGASHGASRNFNVSYADPAYLALVAEALGGWRLLESEAGAPLLDQVGVVTHGGAAWRAAAAALPGHGFEAHVLPAAEAGARWPGLRFEGDVLFTPQAGRLHADRAVRALQDVAAAHGAEVRHRVRVLSVEPGDREVLVRVRDEVADREEAYLARRAVVAAGAWTSALLGRALPLPRLVVTQEQPAHFAPRDATTPWPGFNHAPTPGDPRFGYWPSAVYGMWTPGEGVKAGWHGVGPVVDPDARSFRADPALTASLRRYVAEWLPGADPDAFAEISCTYTTSPDSGFVIDRVGPVTVAAGFSGHGFKFTPAVGRLLADLADGTAGSPAAFALARFAR